MLGVHWKDVIILLQPHSVTTSFRPSFIHLLPASGAVEGTQLAIPRILVRDWQGSGRWGKYEQSWHLKCALRTANLCNRPRDRAGQRRSSESAPHVRMSESKFTSSHALVNCHFLAVVLVRRLPSVHILRL